jgi:hypothetical protein
MLGVRDDPVAIIRCDGVDFSTTPNLAYGDNLTRLSVLVEYLIAGLQISDAPPSCRCGDWRIDMKCLSVSWRHRDHQTRDVSALYGFKVSGNEAMVGSITVCRPLIGRVGYEARECVVFRRRLDGRHQNASPSCVSVIFGVLTNMSGWA